MDRYDKVQKILDDVLQDNKKIIDIIECIITENNSAPETNVFCSFMIDDSESSVQSLGDGFIDALMRGLINRFVIDYKSLENFFLCRYEVTAKIKKKFIQKKLQSDAKVSVEIGIKTPGGKEIYFEDTDVSLVRASTKVVRNAIQFMINCEEAVRVIKLCLQNSREYGRVDMVEKYTDYLTELVKITSYEKVLN